MKDLFHLSILTFLLFAEVWCHFCNEVETLPYIVTILLLACHLGGSQQGLIGDAPLITAYAEGTALQGAVIFLGTRRLFVNILKDAVKGSLDIFLIYLTIRHLVFGFQQMQRSGRVVYFISRIRLTGTLCAKEQ